MERKTDDISSIVETAIHLLAEGRRLGKEQCARCGITTTQLNILKLLQEMGDLSLSELSRRLVSQNSSVTGIIDRMVAAQLVHREQCRQDRRVWRIRLSARGRDIAEQIDVAPWGLLRSALSALGKADRRQLVSILAKVTAHAERAVSESTGVHDAQRGPAS